MFSLMDGFSSYNQIRIALKDQEKIAFTCAWGTFCWNTMPFSLKNTGVAYQQPMTTIFHDMMHTFMEDYVDDLLANSYTREDHIPILDKIFTRLEAFKARLNLKKGAFGVKSGKLLGYIVSTKGIEVDPKKVQAIVNMQPPKNLSQLCSIEGRVQSIQRFISHLVKKCVPFTHLLHKEIVFKWNNQCQTDFDLLENYLMNPPVLVPPMPHKPLLLYISLTEKSIGSLLAQENDQRKEQTIYYISRTLVNYELTYTFIERVCLSIVFASQYLCHYLLTQKVKLMAKIDPLNYLLNKIALTRRLAKWVMVLSEFDIEYVDRKVIKGQATTDQLAEAPIEILNPILVYFPNTHILQTEPITWKFYFHGSYTHHGSGVGILFIMPLGVTIPKSYKLLFPCTNNMKNYEALVLGLKLALEWKLTAIEVYGYSHLVINQVNDMYKTKDEKFLPYKHLVDILKECFVHIIFEQIPRDKNRATNVMATLASLLQLPDQEE